MDYYYSYVKHILAISVGFLAAGVILLFLMGYTKLISGWVLGSLGNIVYFLLLALRVKKLENMDPIQAETEIKKSLAGRFSLVLLIIVVAVGIPSIDILATTIGLISLKPAIYLEAILYPKR